MRTKLFALITIIGMYGYGSAQQSEWQRQDKTDALRGTAYTQFVLTGKFLTPPRQAAAAPVFVMKCSPGEYRHGATWRKNGKYMGAYIVVGAVVNSGTSGIRTQYRLDNGKIHDELWDSGTDGTAIFPPIIELNTVLYGHFLPHKEGSGDSVRKLVISVAEYLGVDVVMEFDMSQSEAAADACGLILHKK